MTGENIKERILAYVGKEEKTNYAIMISGEWGSGKTYLLQNEDGIMKAISQITIPNSDNNKFRPVYVSLSGISTIDRLKELMFNSINLTPSKIKTRLDEDIAQFKNQPSFNDFIPKSEIPLNIVYCFDDLERVHPPFIEELFGYINTYIEHTGNKVLFVCDETKIKKYFEERSDTPLREFGTIKEKYVRRTYRLDADLNTILRHNSIDEGNANLIEQTFTTGRCYNLRTLQFTLESLEEILNEFHIIKHDIDDKYKEIIEKLIVFYTTFVSIEYKKGVSYHIIQEVNFPSRVLSLEERGFQIDLGFENEESPQIEKKEKTEEEINEQNKRDEIEYLYFPRKNDFFPNYPQREPFDSIGEYIDSGEFRLSKLKKEIFQIVDSLKRKEGTEDEKIRKKINTIYDIPDSEVNDVIEEVLNSMKEISYEHPFTYLSLFSDLLVLESFKIHNFYVDENIVKIFTDSIEKSVNDKKLIYEPFLYEKTSGNWTKDSISSIQAEKFHNFRDYILNVNDELDNKTNENSSIETIISAISGSIEDMEVALVKGKENYTLKNTDALIIFKKLKDCNARVIQTFTEALDRRYVLESGHTQASYERGFINKMLDLINDYLNSIDQNRPINYITFFNLKKKLEYWIKYYSLNREKK